MSCSCDPNSLLYGTAGGGRTVTAYNPTMCGTADGRYFFDPVLQQCTNEWGQNGSDDSTFIVPMPYNTHRVPRLDQWKWTPAANERCAAQGSDPFGLGQLNVPQVWATSCQKVGYGRCTDGLCVRGPPRGREIASGAAPCCPADRSKTSRPF